MLKINLSIVPLTFTFKYGIIYIEKRIKGLSPKGQFREAIDQNGRLLGLVVKAGGKGFVFELHSGLQTEEGVRPLRSETMKQLKLGIAELLEKLSF